MTIYAALVSLMNTITNIQIHRRLSASIDHHQILSLTNNVYFLLDFIETYNSHGGNEKGKDLESQIASAAHDAEDVIESHIVDQILVRSTRVDNGETSSNFLKKKIKSIKKKLIKVHEKIIAGFRGKSPCLLLEDLQKVIEELEFVKEKVVQWKEQWGLNDQQSAYSIPALAASSRHLTSRKTTMVGFDDDMMQLLERLTGQQSNRQVTPIVGMGGIGKTTLARNVYQHLLIVEHFHVRGWVTVSQQYSVREIVSEILSCLGKSISHLDQMSEDQLGEQLYKALSGMRYLIILDDMWGIEAWDKIKFFFPDNNNRSRILVTTRLLDVANHFASSALVLDLLDEVESWNLFCETTFVELDCPSQLELIGKKIVKKCKGLPLSIVVIGGLLKKSSWTQEFWENVAKDMSSTLNLAEDNRCLNILSLSYSHLPAHLKPCFLYFGIFREDFLIWRPMLINLWVAEGFIKPNTNQSLEEIAKSYVKDLTDRNLILACFSGGKPRLKSCRIHDLVRELCIQKAKEENFFSARRVFHTPRNIDSEHRIILSRTQLYTFNRSLFGSQECGRPGQLLYRPRVLRVLNDGYNLSLDATFQNVNLRYISYVYDVNATKTYELTSSISLLWSLQTLIISGVVTVVAPPQIWEMPQLRHIKVNKICLPDPVPIDEKNDFVLPNLQTLQTVLNFRCSKMVSRKMPVEFIQQYDTQNQ